jgi:hypothetical protein
MCAGSQSSDGECEIYMLTMRAGKTAWAGVGAATLALAIPASTHAATISVDRTDDPAPNPPAQACTCSLRDAIGRAQNNDTIFVPANASHYTLTRGSLAIAQAGVRILGAEAGSTVIDAGGSSRVLDVTGGSPFISQVTITGGQAASLDGQGGGVRVQAGATLTLVNSTVRNNTAQGSSTNGSGGGIYNAGTLDLRGDTITGNTASALVVNPTAIGVGGAIDSEGQSLTASNSTITGNSAGGSVLGRGGGLFVGAGGSTLTNVTLTSNSTTGLGAAGSNLFVASSSPAQVRNTIVADGQGGSNCSGSVASTGFNLEDANTCSFGQGGDLRNTNPQLGPLADNGGPTYTRALLAGSPAIDAGTTSGCPDIDQRGVLRPQGRSCDIGAFEVIVAGTPPPPAHGHVSVPPGVVVGPVLPPAVFNSTFNLVPVRGKVTYRVPRSGKGFRLVTAVQAPLGTTVDATNGKARIVSARNATGVQQNADFYDGPFLVKQTLNPRQAGAPRSAITDIVLRGGDFSDCDRADRNQIQAVMARRRRRVWGKGKGSYRTRGNYGSASVRGTWWFTKDLCDGTEFYVREGTLKIHDNVRRRFITLRAGQRYLVEAPPDNVRPPRRSQ